MIRILVLTAAAALTTTAAACPTYDSLEISSPDTDADVHEVVTSGIWAVWYHPDAYDAEQAYAVAARLTLGRCQALDTLDMIEPRAPLAGYYTNIILHIADDDILDDGLPNDWENAVGENDDGFSQMELDPDGADNIFTIDHEGWHIMQDQVTNRYEDAEAFSFWIAEASADWFGWIQDPNISTAFDTAAVIVASPQLPFWTESESLPFHMDTNDLIDARPYAFNTFLAYVQLQTPITKRDITGGYFIGNATPQEMMVERLGREGFANVYADFNAKLTAMMIEGDWGDNLDTFIFNVAQRTEAVDGLNDYFDAEEDEDFYDLVHPIAAAVDAEDLLEEWTRPYDAARPFNWGYNVVEIEYPTGTPTLEFKGRNMRLRLVTLVGEEWFVTPVEDGSTLDLDLAESAYLVVTSTPERMGGYDRDTYALRLQ